MRAYNICMQVTYLGTSRDVTICDQCGKVDLTKTVALDVDGEVVYYGVDCAANALRLSRSEIQKGTRAADAAKAKAEYDGMQYYRMIVGRHPLYLEMVEENGRLRQQGIGFKERVELGITQRQEEMYAQARAEVRADFAAKGLWLPPVDKW
jgi:hypothetical protein